MVIGHVLKCRFTIWMTKNHPESLWCRYADDGICHCKTRKEAQALLEALKQRFIECRLEIHTDKTKLVYCKSYLHKDNKYENTSFTFLGYEFRARPAENSKTGEIFTSFLPAISPKAKKSILAKIRELNVRNKTGHSLEQLAKWLNPILRGWINYYGKYTRSEIEGIFTRINGTLAKWSMRKYKKLRNKKTQAAKLMEEIASNKPYLFAHWRIGITGVFI